MAAHHQSHQAIACGRPTPDGKGQCPGQKSVIYVYDENGNCIESQSFPCGVCGQQ
jgi:hypothetical protein